MNESDSPGHTSYDLAQLLKLQELQFKWVWLEVKSVDFGIMLRPYLGCLTLEDLFESHFSHL